VDLGALAERMGLSKLTREEHERFAHHLELAAARWEETKREPRNSFPADNPQYWTMELRDRELASTWRALERGLVMRRSRMLSREDETLARESGLEPIPFDLHGIHGCALIRLDAEPEYAAALVALHRSKEEMLKRAERMLPPQGRDERQKRDVR
jgi:hypothetical protein